MNHYVACLDLRGRDCLVVGGGRVAAEKAAGLLDAGAKVTVVAPEVDGIDGVRVIARPFRRRDVRNRFLVIAATNDRTVNAEVFAAAETRSIPCNVADDPELCSFILPAIVREGRIVAAVSTGGASPALAQRLRDDIAGLLSPRHAELAEALDALRPWAKRELPTYEARRDFFRKLVTEALA